MLEGSHKIFEIFKDFIIITVIFIFPTAMFYCSYINNNHNGFIAAHSYGKNLFMYLAVYSYIVQLRAACKSCRIAIS